MPDLPVSIGMISTDQSAPPFVSRSWRKKGGEFDFGGCPISRTVCAREVGLVTSHSVTLLSVYNPLMSLVEQIQKDIVTAMKAKDEARLSTLRMVKSALHLKTVEKMSPLDDRESQAVLA